MSLNFAQMKNEGEYLLITTDDWFFGKDGQQYRAAWGKCIVHEAKDVLGLKPSQSTNWYLQVGKNKNAMFIGGCRIHYAHVCLDKPNSKEIYCVG